MLLDEDRATAGQHERDEMILRSIRGTNERLDALSRRIPTSRTIANGVALGLFYFFLALLGLAAVVAAVVLGLPLLMGQRA